MLEVAGRPCAVYLPYRELLDEAGDRGREYIASLKAISPRIESIVPPAHDLTDYWESGGDLRRWVARYVANALQGTTHLRWVKVLANAKCELQQNAIDR